MLTEVYQQYMISRPKRGNKERGKTWSYDSFEPMTLSREGTRIQEVTPPQLSFVGVDTYPSPVDYMRWTFISSYMHVLTHDFAPLSSSVLPVSGIP